MKAIRFYLFLLSVALLGMVSCNNKQLTEELEGLKAQKQLEETNKSIVQRYWEGKWEERRIEILDELLTKDVIYHGSSSINGVEEYKQVYSMYRSAFHDTHIVVDELIAEGDKVMSRCQLRGFHKGQLGEIPPTGNELHLKAYTVFRIKDGKIAEEWELLTELEMMMQLGLELK